MNAARPLSRRARAGMAMLAAAFGAAAALSRPATAQNQNFDAVQIDTVKVRDNIYMLVGAGGNQTVQFGDEGVLVVDTQFAPLSAKLLAAIRTVTEAPIRHIINTHLHGDHIGGNENFAKAGRFRAGGNVVGDIGGAATATAHIIAHENVLTRLSAPPAAGQAAVPFAAWPNENADPLPEYSIEFRFAAPSASAAAATPVGCCAQLETAITRARLTTRAGSE